MKFLVLTQYFPPEVGASQVRLAAMCAELASAGHGVEVVTAMPHHPTGRIFPAYRHHFYLRECRNGIPIHRVWLYAGNGSSLKRILSYISFVLTCLCGLFRANRPDYIFVDSPPLLLGVPGWIAAKWWRVPLVFNVADLWPDSVRDLGLMRDGILMRMAFRLERWIYRRASYVTAVTDSIRETLLHCKHVAREKLLFLPNGVDTKLFQPCQPNESLKHALGLEGKRVILYAGNHGHAGAVDQVLYAAARFRDDPSIHFLFLGDGPEKNKLKELSASLRLANVTFRDSVPIESLPSYVSVCDVAVVTLRKSRITKGARPAKAFVMMAAGKPVVLAGEGEAERLMQSAAAGAIVPPENPDALADAIRTVVSDRAQSQQMGMNGRAFVEANFAWPCLVQNWLAQLSGQAQVGSISPKRQLDQGHARVSP